MLGLDCDIKGIKVFVLLQMAEPFEVRKPEYMPCRVCRKSKKKRGLFVYTSNGFLILVPKNYCEGVGGATSLSC